MTKHLAMENLSCFWKKGFVWNTFSKNSWQLCFQKLKLKTLLDRIFLQCEFLCHSCLKWICKTEWFWFNWCHYVTVKKCHHSFTHVFFYLYSKQRVVEKGNMVSLMLSNCHKTLRSAPVEKWKYSCCFTHPQRSYRNLWFVLFLSCIEVHYIIIM